MLNIQLNTEESTFIVERLSKRQEKIHKYIEELDHHLSHPFISESMTKELCTVKNRYEAELEQIHSITAKIMASLDYEG